MTMPDLKKLDFKKQDRAFYSGKQGRWDRIVIPPLTYLSITGQGAPEGAAYAEAIGALYPAAYGIKFACKTRNADFVVPPLEGLWWADDPADFVAGNRDTWQWRMMIRMPDDLTQDAVTAGLIKARSKVGDIADRLVLAPYDEGDSLQTLHIGPYRDEAPVLAALHDDIMPGLGLTFGKAHHEIYLSDPRRVAPEKLKTILRQPVLPRP